MRILVTGASGLLGGRLAELLAERFDVVAARHRAAVPPGVTSVELDVESRVSVDAALEISRPDAVLHSAALANADACERDPAAAARVNVMGSENVAGACRARGLRLVALSTDLVFDGRRSFQSETDGPAPLMTYGRTKLEGEQAVLGSGANAAVARLALVTGRGFGPRGSATEAIAWALREGRPLSLFTDEHRTPVDARSAAAALAVLLEGRHAGCFHLGGPERVSRYELGLRVAARLGVSPAGIEAVRQRERPMPAPRPADVSLDSSRAQQELGFRPRSIDEAIEEGRESGG